LLIWASRATQDVDALVWLDGIVLMHRLRAIAWASPG